MPYASKEDQRAAQKRWREANRERHAAQTRAAKLMQKYGLTIADFDALLESQGHRCAICPSTVPGGRGAWHVDHDHQTGKVRGLLCSHCNRALGMFKDDPEALRAAANYVESHRP
jgi:hypothetical protein